MSAPNEKVVVYMTFDSETQSKLLWVSFKNGS